MANLFTVTAPLSLRKPDGSRQLIAELFPHPEGLLYFDPYWHLSHPDETLHVLSGELKGDGPWKIQGHVINVLGCEGSDPELAGQQAAWNDFLQRADADYPPPGLIAAIARKMGAHV